MCAGEGQRNETKEVVEVSKLFKVISPISCENTVDPSPMNIKACELSASLLRLRSPVPSEKTRSNQLPRNINPIPLVIRLPSGGSPP